MLDRDPERLGGLTRQVAPAPVDGREREPERQLGGHVRGRDDRGLRVQRVEDRLDEEDVDAALGEGRDLLRVGGPHLRERDGAEGGVLDLRRDGERDVERPDRAGDEPRPSRIVCRPPVGGRAREPGALAAHLRRVALERVVGLADRGGRERVRRREIRAGGEVRVVDLGHELRAREVQEIRVALDVVRVLAQEVAAILHLREAAPVDEHAPRPVVDRDATVEDLFQLVDRAHSSPSGCRTPVKGPAVGAGAL